MKRDLFTDTRNVTFTAHTLGAGKAWSKRTTDTMPASLLMAFIVISGYNRMYRNLYLDWQQRRSQTAWEYFERRAT